MEPPREVGPVGRTGAVQPAAGPPRRPHGGSEAQAGDRISLSQGGQEFLAVRRRIAQAPEVRGSLVARLRREIEQGRYDTSGSSVARFLMRALGWKR